MRGKSIKVLVVDDSAFFRSRITQCLAGEPDIEVVGTAADGRAALSLADTLRPDVITMDVDMPVMDGIAAVRALVSKRRVPILMLSALTRQGAETTLEALDAGATDFMTKDTSGSGAARAMFHRDIVTRVRAMATPREAPPRADATARTVNPLLTRAARMRDDLACVIIGASTGGPPVVSGIVEALPAAFPLPILIAQHMPGAFTECFAERLDHQCALTVRLAKNEDRLDAGTVYIAPGGLQTLLRRDGSQLCVEISPGHADARYRPCIDTTFRSAARVCGARVLAIVLTGMGDDGCRGGQILKRCGAQVWAQDEASSVVYGMPRAVIEAGLADAVLSSSAIAPKLMAAL